MVLHRNDQPLPSTLRQYANTAATSIFVRSTLTGSPAGASGAAGSGASVGSSATGSGGGTAFATGAAGAAAPAGFWPRAIASISATLSFVGSTFAGAAVGSAG